MTNQKGLFVRCLIALFLFAGLMQSTPVTSRAEAPTGPSAQAPAGPSAQAWERIWNEVEQPDGTLLQPPPVFPEKILTVSDGTSNDEFGSSVALSGDTVVIGASNTHVDGKYLQGAAYVFERNRGGADNWGQAAKLTASDGLAFDYFGTAVGLSGDTLVVGSWATINGNERVGAVNIFERNQGGMDNWGQVTKLTVSNGGSFTYFGDALALSGDTLVVGAWGDDIGGVANVGAAYVFERNQGGVDQWGLVAKLTVPNGGAETEFGSSVSLSGDTLVVGAVGDDIGGNVDAGAAYIFYRHQGGADNWGQVTKLTISNGGADTYFGGALALSGDLLVVGARGDDVDGNANQGAAYLFARDQGGADNWGQVKKLTASDGAVWDNFGESVAINGELVLVGADAADIGANLNQGAVYVFGRDWGWAGNWGQRWKINAAFGAPNDLYGFSLALSGNALVVGMPYGDVGGNADQGVVYLYSLTALAQAELTPAVVYTSDDGHIHELALKGRWQERDLTSAAGAPLVEPSNQPMGFVRSDGVAMVVYKGVDKHIHAIYLEQQPGSPWHETWHVADLCQITASPDALSDPYGFVRSDGISVVYYTGTDMHIHELRLEGGGWIWADLSYITGAPAVYYAEVTPYIRGDRLNAILFISRTNYDLYELRLQPDGWKYSDLTALSGAPLPRSYPSAMVRSDGITALTYTYDRHIIELRLEGGNWLWADLTDLSGAPDAIINVTRLTSGYVRSDGINALVYETHDGAGRIYELRLDNGWQAYELTSVKGAVPGYYPIAYVRADGINAVVYLGTDQHIQELRLGATWIPADLTSLAGASPAGYMGQPWPYNRPYIPSHIFLPMVRK